MNSYPLLTDKKKRRNVARMIAGWLKRRNEFLDALQEDISRNRPPHQCNYSAWSANLYNARADAARQILMELFE